MVRSLEQRWSLAVGAPYDGDEVSCAWVAPVVLADGTPAVLKIGMPHMEAEHEIEGLRFWNGDPTVRLFDADVTLGAMLLERCAPGTHLRTAPEAEQDVVIAGLLRRLWKSPTASHSFRPLSVMLEHWSEETLSQRKQWRDPGLVREGLHLFTELSRIGIENVLLGTDVHAGNVLRAKREPWLAIDPKPFVGDPAYDATQHLLNCTARLVSDPDGTIRRFAGLLGLESQRIRLWMFARLAAEPRDDWKRDRLTQLARAIAP